MRAKEYLSQVQNLNRRIDNRMKQLEDLKARAMSMGSMDSSGDRVRNSGQVTMADRVTEYVALEARVNQMIDEYIKVRDRITDEINSLDDERYIMLLGRKYLEGRPFTEIAAEMGYDYYWTCKLHGHALHAFEERWQDRLK